MGRENVWCTSLFWWTKIVFITALIKENTDVSKQRKIKECWSYFLSIFFKQNPRADSYRYAVTPGGEDPKKGKKKKSKKENLDELKQELEMDEHKVPIEELYARLGSDPSMVFIRFYNHSCFILIKIGFKICCCLTFN